jgi:Family of unknown function (DUF5682)
MRADTRLYGIRHHGPGSARRLIEALGRQQPKAVLIEGPADASELLKFLQHTDMLPPVALLTYPADDPSQASFWPLAAYSPEYQAARWALAHGATVRFIDLPASWHTQARDESDEATGVSDDDPIARDPVGTLARAAGYEDGESWWRDVIEENPDPGPIFGAVAEAMTALRAEASPPNRFEQAREAHMRLEIARAEKEIDGPIAVVCGAWHVPALASPHTQKDDRALIAGAPRRAMAATWAPWTSPRLAAISGYGAGVSAPGWCQHLWDSAPGTATTRWLARIAQTLRDDGNMVSTASVIEAERLALTLSAMRDRPTPGFEELREAAIACLCYGEAAVWETVSLRLLIGSDVGSIPDGVPLAPLLDDLKRQQTRTRMKPEALEREFALDLRTDSGLDRSTLLHRLNLLGVHWGVLTDIGRSRGTFRERWTLAWKPEFAVQLVENLVHGATIESAAAGRLTQELQATNSLPMLAEKTRGALTAQLAAAATTGVHRLETRAAQSGDAQELLETLSPLADILRYGEARATDTATLAALFDRIAIGGAIALPYAARNLDADAAALLAGVVRGADKALTLVAANGEAIETWRRTLQEVADNAQTSPRLSGLATRMLYEAETITPQAAADHLSLRLSPGVAIADAAAYFEGFFEGGGERLIYDTPLRAAVDAWILTFEEEDFIAHLPVFRRVLSALDKMQRRRLLDAVMGRNNLATLTGLELVPQADEIWTAHLDSLLRILQPGEKP